jgi:hypothetical protein
VFELRAGNAAGNLSIRGLMLTAATPLRLTAMGFVGDSFTLSVPTSNGTSYVLECKDLRSATNWLALPAVADSNGVLTLADSVATNAQRFYRVRVTAP